MGKSSVRSIGLFCASASALTLAICGTSSSALAQSAEKADSAASQDDSAIIVTGRRAAMQAADQRKKNSDAIINSVVADEAGKLPDNSITEVLQRVSGVTIVRFGALGDPDHFSVEGSGIQVRGLSGVASRLNGREIFSANGGRALNWGDVTPELMQAVDVYKSSTADLIEGGTGGQVDLSTKLPFNFSEGWHFSGSADISQGDLAKATDYSASGLIAGRWNTGIGDIGIVVDLAQSRLTSRSNFFRAEQYYRQRLPGEAEDVFIPGGYDYGDEEFARDRGGIYAALQWAPNSDLTLTGIFFQSKYKNRNQSRFAMQASQSLTVNREGSRFDENGGLLSTDSMFLRNDNTFEPTGGAITGGGGTEGTRAKSMTRDISAEFEWNPGQGPLKLSGSYQHVLSTSKANRLAVFRDVAFPSSFAFDLTGKFPLVTLPEPASGQFTNPANYFWSAAMPHDEDNRGKMDSVNLDAEYVFEDSFFKGIKVGGRWSDRRERDLNNQYTWTALGRGWNGDPQMTFANARPGDVDSYAFENFFHGAIPIPAQMLWPSLSLIENTDVDDLHSSPGNFCGPFDWGNATYFNCSSAGPISTSTYGGARTRVNEFLPQDLGTWRTKSLAGYVHLRFGKDYDGTSMGFGGNVGVRVVRVKNESAGFIVQNSFSFIRDGQRVDLAQRVDPRGGSATFTRFLPSVNLMFQPAEQVKIRASYNITMDLPNFNATRGTGSIGVETTPNPANVPGSNINEPGLFRNFTASTGEPTLPPAMSNNFDLSAEWYVKPGTMFYLNGFYKRITHLPIYSLTQREVTIYYQNGTSENVLAAATDTVSATKPATVKGFEVGGRMFFDMLPGVLAGIGVEGNYTFIDSKNPGDIYRDIFGMVRNDAPLQGLSKHNYNIALLYERGKLSTRVAYSWRSAYLQSTNANGTSNTYIYRPTPSTDTIPGTVTALPVYGDAYGQVDAGVTLKITDNFAFTLQGTNLFNATQRTLMGGYKNNARYTRSWFQSDRRLKLGFNLSF